MDIEYKSQAQRDFEAAWLTTNWTALTATQKQTHIANHYALKIASAKEAEANRIQAEADEAAATVTRRQQAITYLTNHGFACDNSLADWQKLYNRPHIFGANWNAQAEYQFGLGKDLDYFLQTAYNLWKEFN